MTRRPDQTSTTALQSRASAAAADPARSSLAELPVTLHPDRALLTYGFLTSLLLGPFFFTLLIPLYFRYHSLRYDVEEEGITMRWGILFRKEISLTYARIQDIHLSSNVVERWLGIAKIQVQTASGSSSAEMTIEGLRNYSEMRDFLYTRMRGARDRPAQTARGIQSASAPHGLEDLTDTLTEVAAELRALRLSLADPAAQSQPIQSGPPNV